MSPCLATVLFAVEKMKHDQVLVVYILQEDFVSLFVYCVCEKLWDLSMPWQHVEVKGQLAGVSSPSMRALRWAETGL